MKDIHILIIIVLVISAAFFLLCRPAPDTGSSGPLWNADQCPICQQVGERQGFSDSNPHYYCPTDNILWEDDNGTQYYGKAHYRWHNQLQSPYNKYRINRYTGVREKIT